MQISKDDLDAIEILRHLIDHIDNVRTLQTFERFTAEKCLRDAIYHLAYPDRAVYPKVRHSRKGDPIVRRRER